MPILLVKLIRRSAQFLILKKRLASICKLNYPNYNYPNIQMTIQMFLCHYRKFPIGFNKKQSSQISIFQSENTELFRLLGFVGLGFDLFCLGFFPKFRRTIFILNLSWRGSLSYRNQSIDLLCKSMDWFLYDNGLRHERDKFVEQAPLRVNIVWSKR